MGLDSVLVKIPEKWLFWDTVIFIYQELAKEKWLCPLSGKKFKAPEFVRKHIFNKFQNEVDQVRAIIILKSKTFL